MQGLKKPDGGLWAVKALALLARAGPKETT